MPRSVKKFIPTHNTSTVDAKTRFRNVSEQMELQIPFVLHRYFNCDDQETNLIIKTYSPPTFCHFCLDTKVTQKSSPKKGDCSAPLQSWDALHPHLFHDIPLSLVFGLTVMIEVCDFDLFIIHNLLYMSRKITNFMSVHIMRIIETITLFRNLSERMELQIPVILHLRHKLQRSGAI